MTEKIVPLKNDRYLRALLRQPVDRTPVWLMRQAGRYLPEYRALRAQVGDFMSLCRDPELACEVALQPLRRFALDAAIVFSDILTIPDAMGLGLYFRAGEGPRFQRPIMRKADIQRLPIPDPEDGLGYVMAAVRTLRHALANAIPLIGFSGAPWTLAAYMLGGSRRCQFNTIRAMVRSDPTSLHLLLDKLADTVILYLNGQIRAGAQAVMIFDTWGGLLSSDDYPACSLHYLHKIIAHLIREQHAQRIPVTLFTRGGGQWLEALADTGCDALGIDWQIDLSDARRRVGHRVALQGNLNPALLHQATPAELQKAVAHVLSSYGSGPGHVFNLGHGIPQQATPEQVQVVLDAVQRYVPAE